MKARRLPVIEVARKFAEQQPLPLIGMTRVLKQKPTENAGRTIRLRTVEGKKVIPVRRITERQ
jgi:hypothetical protein